MVGLPIKVLLVADVSEPHVTVQVGVYGRVTTGVGEIKTGPGGWGGI